MEAPSQCGRFKKDLFSCASCHVLVVFGFFHLNSTQLALLYVPLRFAWFHQSSNWIELSNWIGLEIEKFEGNLRMRAECHHQFVCASQVERAKQAIRWNETRRNEMKWGNFFCFFLFSFVVFFLNFLAFFNLVLTKRRPNELSRIHCNATPFNAIQFNSMRFNPVRLAWSNLIQFNLLLSLTWLDSTKLNSTQLNSTRVDS